MPLIRGETDPRLDKLKAWIIDQKILESASGGSKRGLLSYFRKGETTESLIEQFYDVIRELTPGMNLGHLEIDQLNKQVRVRPDQAGVRIELLSEGTQSLLGWVGVLLRRLNDFYSATLENQQSATKGNAPSLLEQPALVLMDEIDAHMHPKWQQIVVSKLKNLFPNCQFIATTHSPLIVVGLEQREVFLLRQQEAVSSGEFPRASESADRSFVPQVVVERPPHSLRGWGADQVLTGALFGLQTVLDPKIY